MLSLVSFLGQELKNVYKPAGFVLGAVNSVTVGVRLDRDKELMKNNLKIIMYLLKAGRQLTYVVDVTT